MCPQKASRRKQSLLETRTKGYLKEKVPERQGSCLGHQSGLKGTDRGKHGGRLSKADQETAELGWPGRRGAPAGGARRPESAAGDGRGWGGVGPCGPGRAGGGAQVVLIHKEQAPGGWGPAH